MEVSRQILTDLLELQRIDSTIDRLNNRLRSLPEQEQLDNVHEELAAMEAQAGEWEALLGEVAGKQRKLDNEIDSISRKISAEEGRLYSGDVTNPRELSSLVAEVESLKRRLSRVEDADLEVMQEREEHEARSKEIAAELARLKEQIVVATAERDRASGEIGVDLAKEQNERKVWAERFDPELLAFYDDLRASKGGVAAAALSGETCLGCHMRLPAQEVTRIRRSQGMVKCDECGRVLVVT